MAHTLLLADPSAAIRRVVEMTFAETGVEVVSASDGEEAIARISEQRPDIVLADIGMPKRNGYDVCAWVKAHDDFKEVPVLLLAGAFEPVDDDRAREAGCNGVLVKPFEPQHVIARVQELIGGATGAPTRATGDVPRPPARLTPPRPVELPPREPQEVPADLVDVGEGDFDGTAGEAERPSAPPAGRLAGAAPAGDPLDDYFDQLDEAVASVGDRLGTRVPAGDADDADDGDLPTLEDLLGGGGEAVPAGDPGDEADAGPVPTLEDLLGGAEGDAGPDPQVDTDRDAVLPPATSPAAAPAAGEGGVSEALVEEVTARVTDRLAAGQSAEIEQAVVRAVEAAAGPAVRQAVERAAAGLADRLASETRAAVDAAVPQVLDRVAATVTAAAEQEVTRVVTGVVSEVSERLVQEEIARIREKA